MGASSKSVLHWKLKQASIAGLRQAAGVFVIGIVASIGLLIATIVQHPDHVQVTDVAETRFGELLFFTSTIEVGTSSFFAQLDVGLGVWILILVAPLVVGFMVFLRALYRHGSFVAGVD